MRDVKPIMSTQHGSLLYGTNTPLSDVDLKSIHLPSGRAIILQHVKKREQVIDRGIKLSETKKNQAGDVDDQSFVLGKYLGMITDGDTNAIEMLFAPEKNIVVRSDEWAAVRQIGLASINRKCRGFVGYVQRQVATYSVKGERLRTVQNVTTVLHKAVVDHGTSAKLATIEPLLQSLALEYQHCDFLEIESQGKLLNHFVCVDRKMPLSATIKFAADLMQKVLNEYGERARRAMQNDNVDWKAVSHAVRIAEEAIELLRDGVITFPRPNAKELLRIKQGEMSYDAMGERIQDAVIEVEKLSLTSQFPEDSDKQRIEDFVFDLYSTQIR